MINYYHILGISDFSPLSSIKKAYRVAAKRHHPDNNQGNGSNDQFLQIQKAYEVLSDKKLKSHYDQQLKSHLHSRQLSVYDGKKKSGAVLGLHLHRALRIANYCACALLYAAGLFLLLQNFLVNPKFVFIFLAGFLLLYQWIEKTPVGFLFQLSMRDVNLTWILALFWSFSTTFYAAHAQMQLAPLPSYGIAEFLFVLFRFALFITWLLQYTKIDMLLLTLFALYLASWLVKHERYSPYLFFSLIACVLYVILMDASIMPAYATYYEHIFHIKALK